MPSWSKNQLAVVNQLVVTGPPNMLDQFERFARGKGIAGDEDLVFDFHRVAPVPLLFVDAQALAIRPIDIATLKAWRKDPDSAWHSSEMPESVFRQIFESYRRKFEERAERDAKYGYTDWYGWARDNWGTTYNAFQPKLTRDKNKLVYTFKSAGHSPLPVVKKASEQHPQLQFNLQYSGERASDAGNITYYRGMPHSTSFNDMRFTGMPDDASSVEEELL